MPPKVGEERQEKQETAVRFRLKGGERPSRGISRSLSVISGRVNHCLPVRGRGTNRRSITMNSVGPSCPQARTRDLLSKAMPDGLMVYDTERHQAHSLNRTATLIWQQCDGKTSVAEL